MKVCSKCKEAKELSDFYTGKDKVDGLRSNCKTCVNITNAKWRKENREKALAASKEWNKKNPERLVKATVKWAKNNPYKKQAHRSVEVALKNRTLVRPKKCSVGNERCSGRIEAHHPDYRDPLGIQWLCKNHHIAWHKLFLTECTDES